MNKQTILKNSIKLREFVNSVGDEQNYNTHAQMNAQRNEPKHDTITAQLNSISWQLKRIADALEGENK